MTGLAVGLFVGGRSLSAQTPAGLSGLAMYLDSTYRVFSDVAATVPVADGDRVAAWEARTGQTFLQASPSLRPYYRAGGGRPSVEFPVGTTMRMTSSLAGLTAVTLCSRMSVADLTSPDAAEMINLTGGSNGLMFGQTYANAKTGRSAISWDVTSGTSPLTRNACSTWLCTSEAGSLFFRVDGVAVDSAAVSPAYNGAVALAVGPGGFATNAFRVFDHLLYGRILDGGEIARLEAWQAAIVAAPAIAPTVSVGGLVATVSLHNSGGPAASASFAGSAGSPTVSGSGDGPYTLTYGLPGTYAIAVRAINAGGSSSASLSATAWSPASFGSLAMWFDIPAEAAAGVLRQGNSNSGATASAAGDPVGYVPDRASRGSYAVVDPGNAGSLATAGGILAMMTGGASAAGARYAFGSPLTVSGEFQFYARVVRSGANAQFTLLGGTTTAAFLGWYYTLFYLSHLTSDTNVSAASGALAGLSTVRLRRDGSDAVYLRVNGSESLMGTLPGDVLFENLFARTFGTPTYAEAGNGFVAAVLNNGAFDSANDASCLTYLDNLGA